MSFIIYPAIDIRGGKCVRLFQGDYAQETVYADSSLAMAKRWVEQGAAWVHLVDLDGAKEGKPANADVIKDIARSISVPVQVGGGIRTEEQIADYLEAGVARVIVGTAAIEDEPFTQRILQKYGDKIAIGLDCRNGLVATRGWLTTTDVQATELAKRLVSYGAEMFIYTDIARDGTLTGPNVEEISALAIATGKSVIASGGVSNLDDLLVLSAHETEGVSGAIVGKALYTDAFTLAEALSRMEERESNVG
ncbi:1-(5-phosphoribosyl)-5-[(5-phosphoribosylamino) methylideneamino] imidazole-4-carboxamide isomerase [Brevibacillus reuszeri]|uniref:1-(5-phosphoribosyl)-5-[(5-phosphoribosylamino)methylideneamino] imidazole-4-carboxamide isomerase n=1 Tax=Brevibacillus reuszeri TaxID=54915 RepID=A0A0K9YTD9_9BACL|nr:1-(5-phosphoribosyl)-5-[(5-phosphoribosylamino)methylideneamino]imidazole-4-carboxamide isomerase [Brevibacillus reuszeri]KNB71951.1 1-(5-phosphoribosyl)-5-[(5-phosphoribosylamino)methylideneamino] imidazole-4-carboxamide isomerase [Brevibacillus reuszeri]MED1855209.1 1-(5-phosphoribosyl)-5-[(5-phosphoribosylamino)methylideneamino]imidazole-4-carboxamide isomerase [Brevibacillus reuszeri]GED67641.1 1-(5-phosphoribosyl)-5-[(5-phosphoribosylamino) methylideneamino] imidazole-4-carboxamide isome